MGKDQSSVAATSPLATLAQRLAGEQNFLACVLQAYRQPENLSDDALAARLHTSPEMLTRLALCKRPKVDSPQFAEDVRQIAAYAQVDAAELAILIREVDG